MSLKVGQKLWYAHKRGSVKKWVTVLKVGRKYATMEGCDPINLSDLSGKADAYGSHGKCYLDREEYETRCRADRLYQKLRNSLGWVRGDIAAEDIIAAAKLLRISLEGA